MRPPWAIRQPTDCPCRVQESSIQGVRVKNIATISQKPVDPSLRFPPPRRVPSRYKPEETEREGRESERSEHPLAKAVLRKTSQLALQHEEPDAFEYIPGRGIKAHLGNEEILVGSRSFLQGSGVQTESLGAALAESEIWVARRGRPLGSLVVSERLRSGGRQAVQALNTMGLRTVLLTGDTKVAAKRVGKELGVEEVAFELL